MKNYDKKIIIDYINGNDINNYSLEELEDDKDFMLDVIKLTNDNKMYNHCSLKVKKDLFFVKEVIMLFKEDKEFITKVTDNYLDKNIPNDDKLEVLILLNSLLSKSDSYYLKYKVLLAMSFKLKKIELEMIKEENKKDEDTSKELGLGFILVFDRYYNEPLVLDFFAKELFLNSFIKNNLSLEEHLHNKFNEETYLSNIITYLLSYLSFYDEMLSSYLSSKPYLLNDILTPIKKNWTSYNYKKEKEVYLNLMEEVHNYLENISKKSFYYEEEWLYFVGKELGIIDKIYKYDIIDENSFIFINKCIKKMDPTYFPFLELRHYQNIKNIMLNSLDVTKNKEKTKVLSKVIKPKFN